MPGARACMALMQSVSVKIVLMHFQFSLGAGKIWWSDLGSGEFDDTVTPKYLLTTQKSAN